MATIVHDLPPEEETPSAENHSREGPKVFPPSVEDDDALARRLQAEWDAENAASRAASNNVPVPTPTTVAKDQFPRTPNENSVATVSNAWEFDVVQYHCTSCKGQFNPFNRRHHCRLCGKIFCGKCSDQRALVPPSSIVLTPGNGGKHAKPPSQQYDAGSSISFSPDPDPDRMLTYIDEDKQLLYGKGLEERFLLAREPLRVCTACYAALQPLQEELRTTNSNAMRFNYIDPTDPKRFLNSPLAFTLGHEVRKAAYALNNMLPLPKRMGSTIGGFDDNYNNNNNPDNFLTGDDLDLQQCKDECASITPNFSNLDGVQIPARLLEQAKGVAVMTVAKGGFGIAGFEFGTGLVVARIGDDQQWSAPCAIGAAGMSWGALIGAQVSDHVFLLMTDAAVELMFTNDGNLQLGADIGVAIGPVGRAFEADFAAKDIIAGPGAFSPIYTYSLSKGLFAGISLDGKVIVTRNRVNEKFYGRQITGRQILNGEIPSPPAARPLYDALQRCHVYAKNNDGGVGDGLGLSILNRPKTHAIHGYPELPPNSMDPYSNFDNSGIPATGHLHRQEQMMQSPHQPTPTNLFGEYGDPLMPPAPNDQHSYAGQSAATGMSDITSDPRY